MNDNGFGGAAIHIKKGPRQDSTWLHFSSAALSVILKSLSAVGFGQLETKDKGINEYPKHHLQYPKMLAGLPAKCRMGKFPVRGTRQ
jgi:hypothetical protein